METVDDILRDIRSRAEVACRQDEDAAVHHSAVDAMLRDIADHIEAAHKRDIEAVVDQNEISMKTAIGEVTRLRAENERLKSAIVRVRCCLDSTCGEMGVCRTCELMRLVGAE